MTQYVGQNTKRCELPTDDRRIMLAGSVTLVYLAKFDSFGDADRFWVTEHPYHPDCLLVEI